MVYKDGIFNVIDKAFTIVLEASEMVKLPLLASQMVLEGPPRSYVFVENVKGVTIKTPTQEASLEDEAYASCFRLFTFCKQNG